MNLVRASVANGGATLEGEGWRSAPSPANARKALKASTPEVMLGARHSTIAVRKDQADGAIAGRVYTVEPTGDITFCDIHLGKAIIVA